MLGTALAAWLPVLGLAVPWAACASPADVQRSQDAAWAAVEQDADQLYAALQAVAAQRHLPVDRDDPQQRRLTSFWIAESADLRRRYFLAVLLSPAGLALHARIARQQHSVGEDGEPVWVDLEPTEAVTAEQQAIVQDAYTLWSAGN